MNAAQAYAEALKEARSLQIRNEAGAVVRLEGLLTDVAAEVRHAIRRTPKGILGERYRRDLLASLDQALARFRAEYKEQLDGGIVAAARIAEERERRLVEGLLHSRGVMRPDDSLTLLNELGRTMVTFGRVPQLVLERAYARVYPDGLKLSQRLYRLDVEGRRDLADTVIKGLAKGTSARELGRSIEAQLTQTGVDNVRYKAMRIARTEINTAYREGHVASVTDEETGKLKSFVSAIGWRLSPAHPRVDICDTWASDEVGLGEGNYEPGDVPPGHPHCMCFTVSILAAYPDEQWSVMAPRPELVPESQIRYYKGQSREEEDAA